VALGVDEVHSSDGAPAARRRQPGYVVIVWFRRSVEDREIAQYREAIGVLEKLAVLHP